MAAAASLMKYKTHGCPPPSLPGPDPSNTPGSDSPGNPGESLSIKRAGLGGKPVLRKGQARKEPALAPKGWPYLG